MTNEEFEKIKERFNESAWWYYESREPGNCVQEDMGVLIDAMEKLKAKSKSCSTCGGPKMRICMSCNSHILHQVRKCR